MSAQTTHESVNDVRLIGRVSTVPEEKLMPSGSVLISFRIVTDRPPSDVSGVRVDALECSSWSARVRRSAQTWHKGDVVEVSGSVRRRFFATASGRASRVEIEVSSARMVRRAPSA